VVSSVQDLLYFVVVRNASNQVAISKTTKRCRNQPLFPYLGLAPALDGVARCGYAVGAKIASKGPLATHMLVSGLHATPLLPQDCPQLLKILRQSHLHAKVHVAILSQEIPDFANV
jgi:hypothetical protein